MDLNLATYHLTYDQEFSPGTPFNVSPDGTVEFKSQFDWGGRSVPTNHEAEYYSDPAYGVNPFKVENGELTITASPTPANFPADGQPYVSGLITTQETFSQHGGYFEMRAQVPPGAGLWPAFWLLPTTAQDWPELDAMENPNLPPRSQYWTHATGADNGGGGFVKTGEPLARGYHRYGLEWNDQTVTFYFDGVAIGECGTPTDMAGLDMYMLINLAVGGPGSWPGQPGPHAIPANYRIDYIRAFSNDQTVPEVKLQPISSPDGVDTTPVMTPPVMPVVTTGSGPQSLVLYMNEDYFQADAKFTVEIDGVQQGGVFTTIAPKSQGLIQDFVFNGSFTPGVHTLTLHFLNNVDYGPYYQRNLYVQSSTIDGQSVAGGSMAAYKDGKQSFEFTVPG